jgi:beta-lactamase superfamily II metal-dependent hydrolase
MKRKILIFVIISIILISALASCTVPQESEESSQVSVSEKLQYPITEYTVVRSEWAPKEVVLSAVGLRKHINSLLTDATIDIKDDWVKGGVITEEIANSKEILIGNTTRPESAAALEGVNNTSFVIKVIGNKIVINAEKTTILLNAIQYFIDNYVNISDNVLLLEDNLCYVSEPVPQVEFIKRNEHDLKVIYLDSLDNSTTPSNVNDRLDLDVLYAKELRDTIHNFVGIKLVLTTDWVRKGTDVTEKYEILVGNTSRPETMQFLKSIEFDQYGFAVIGNKIVVSGWNETTTEIAVDRFIEFFKANVVKHEDGTYSFSMLLSDRVVYDDRNDWFVDYPKFDGGTLTGTQDAGYGNLQVYYEDATLEQFNDYCNKLESSDFKLYMQNELAGNVHKCYTSKQGMLYVYFVPVEKSVRIVSCPDGKYNLPQYITPESVPAYEKIADTSITQMSLSYAAGNFGLCHIITLEDGSFIVYDGGGNSNNDYVRLYNTLKALNKRKDGKIVVAAWILTHEHWDHYTNFATFCKNYSHQLVLEGMYCNTPSGSYAYNGYNPNYYMNSDFINLSSTLGGVPKYIVHTGMKFYIRNACVEILYTQEDLYPTKLYYFNDCTMVSRVTVAGQTITYLGDVRYEGSDIMSERYGKELESEIVQISHHGFDGGTVELYTLLNPKTCLWPTSKENFTNMSAGKTTSGYYAVDTFILSTLKVPTNIYAEPTSTIMLPFTLGDKITYWEY